MSTPFGFEPGSGGDPAGAGDLSAMFANLARLTAGQSGPVNWQLAGEVAQREAAAEGDPAVDTADATRTAEALRLADVWLDGATALPSGVVRAEAWTRRRWLEETLPRWRALCDPVARRVAEAMTSTMQGGLASLAGELGEGRVPEGLALPPGVDASALAGLVGAGGGLSGPLAPLQGIMAQMSGLMFGQQVGAALGGLARGVLSSTEVGLPLGPDGVAALLPAAVAGFGADLAVDAEQVRLFLAAREAAHHRLFAAAPWLRGHLTGLVEEVARGTGVDPDAVAAAMSGLDPSDPASLQRALTGGMFEVEPTPAQQAARDRLETGLALVEGWVDAVVAAAVGDRLPAAVALREAVRRRRASGGPTEEAFASLVGLELRPRRLRDAAALWQALGDVRGSEGRDAVWASLDLLPIAADLDDPAAWVAGSDPALEALDPIAAIEALGDAEAPREEVPGADRDGDSG